MWFSEENENKRWACNHKEKEKDRQTAVIGGMIGLLSMKKTLTYPYK